MIFEILKKENNTNTIEDAIPLRQVEFRKKMFHC